MFSSSEMHDLQSIINTNLKVLRLAKNKIKKKNNLNSLLSFVSEMEPVSGKNLVPRSHSLISLQLLESLRLAATSMKKPIDFLCLPRIGLYC